jgi:hypothetical protein
MRNLTTSKGAAMEVLNRALPYPEQMKEIDLEKDGAIYFTWRGDRYKFEFGTCMVMKSCGCTLEGTSASLLMERLIKRELANIIIG